MDIDYNQPDISLEDQFNLLRVSIARKCYKYKNIDLRKFAILKHALCEMEDDYGHPTEFRYLEHEWVYNVAMYGEEAANDMLRDKQVMETEE